MKKIEWKDNRLIWYKVEIHKYKSLDKVYEEIFGTPVKLLLGYPHPSGVPVFESQVCSPFQLPANTHLGGSRLWCKDLGPYHPRKFQTQSPAPGLSRLQSQPLQTWAGEEREWTGDRPVYQLTSLSNKSTIMSNLEQLILPKISAIISRSFCTKISLSLNCLFCESLHTTKTS